MDSAAYTKPELDLHQHRFADVHVLLPHLIADKLAAMLLCPDFSLGNC